METGSTKSIETVTEIAARESWSIEDYDEIVASLFQVNDAPGKFRAVAAEMEAGANQITGAVALKIGIARYILCRFADALEALGAATDNKDRRYFQGLCRKCLGMYERAAEEFERARARGWPDHEVDAQIIEIQALAGKVDQARKSLAKLGKKASDTADYHYLDGLVTEMSGDPEAACDAYVRARQIDAAHAGATFRLAYACDLHGDTDQAIELYRECVASPPVHANALLNLAVLYEDAGQYHTAADCLRRILATRPNHERARLFLRDVEASKTMYFDEDQAKRIAHHNAILDIPVTDFELSVRARNCLKKMDIRTLGDLVRISEAELLGYKNFGETSLKEIKDMLAAKGLTLGQELEKDQGAALPGAPQPVQVDTRKDAVLATPIDQVELSIRSRKALENLRAATLGELADKTEAELLACRNFGQTSLNEIRQRLSEYGLQLREPD